MKKIKNPVMLTALVCLSLGLQCTGKSITVAQLVTQAQEVGSLITAGGNSPSLIQASNDFMKNYGTLFPDGIPNDETVCATDKETIETTIRCARFTASI